MDKEGGKKRKASKNPEAKARRKELSGIKSNLGRLKRRVDGFWYSRLPFSGASGFRRRVLLVRGVLLLVLNVFGEMEMAGGLLYPKACFAVHVSFHSLESM